MHALHHRFTETRVFCEGEEPEVGISNIINFERKITSDDAIAIYVPRAFQRIYHNPLILQHVRKAQLLVCLERFCAVSDIRSRHSSYWSKPPVTPSDRCLKNRHIRDINGKDLEASKTNATSVFISMMPMIFIFGFT